MGLRMVLVGVVAGLGLTLPTGRQLSYWRDSAQSWMTIRLAEWDAQLPVDEDAFVLIAEPTRFSPPIARPKPLVGPPAPVPEHRKLAEVPTVVPAKPAISPTEIELSSGLDVPTEPTAFDDTVFEPFVVATPETPTDDAFNAAQEGVLAGFEADRLAHVETPAAESPALVIFASPALIDTSDNAFNAAMAGVLTTFEVGRLAIADAPAVEPSTTDWVVTPVPFQKLEDLFSDIALAHDVNREAESFKPEAPTVMTSESLDIGEDLYTGLAYLLNREAGNVDGPRVEPSPRLVRTDLTSPAVGRERLSTAVRLTREAVYAWASLLHSPAVVTIAH